MKRLFLIVTIVLCVLSVSATALNNEKKTLKLNSKRISKTEQVEQKTLNIEKSNARVKTDVRAKNSAANSKKQTINNTNNSKIKSNARSLKQNKNNNANSKGQARKNCKVNR